MAPDLYSALCSQRVKRPPYFHAWRKDQRSAAQLQVNVLRSLTPVRLRPFLSSLGQVGDLPCVFRASLRSRFLRWPRRFRHFRAIRLPQGQGRPAFADRTPTSTRAVTAFIGPSAHQKRRPAQAPAAAMERTASASIAAAPAVITVASPSGWASPSERPARRKENNRGEQLVAAGRRTARRAGPGSLNYLRRGRRKIRPRQGGARRCRQRLSLARNQIALLAPVAASPPRRPRFSLPPQCRGRLRERPMRPLARDEAVLRPMVSLHSPQ